jgi:hypothetical protein
MTFIEFKKRLLDIEMTLPKFCNLIQVSDKNIQSYKKKGEVPNAIAVVVTCFYELHKQNIDFQAVIEDLGLKKRTKKGGFAKKDKKEKNRSTHKQ